MGTKNQVKFSNHGARMHTGAEGGGAPAPLKFQMFCPPPLHTKDQKKKKNPNEVNSPSIPSTILHIKY